MPGDQDEENGEELEHLIVLRKEEADQDVGWEIKQQNARREMIEEAVHPIEDFWKKRFFQPSERGIHDVGNRGNSNHDDAQDGHAERIVGVIAQRAAVFDEYPSEPCYQHSHDLREHQKDADPDVIDELAEPDPDRRMLADQKLPAHHGHDDD